MQPVINGPNSRPLQHSSCPISDLLCAVKATNDSIAFLDKTAFQQPAISGCDRSQLFLRKDPACNRKLFMEPPLKRLKCSVLKIEPSILIPPAAKFLADDGKNFHKCIVSKAAAIWDGSIFNMYNEDKKAYDTMLASEANDKEEEESGCKTPTATEQCILQTKDLECPPPPKKRKTATFKRGTTWPSAHHSPNLLISPPDLDPLPEYIRALFDK